MGTAEHEPPSHSHDLSASSAGVAHVDAQGVAQAQPLETRVLELEQIVTSESARVLELEQIVTSLTQTVQTLTGELEEQRGKFDLLERWILENELDTEVEP